jgi:TetR/AcrR family transcriptional repressor of nem operon
MPRVSKVEAQKNREKILEASVHLFKEKGFQVSVADLMAAADLTPGGFYGHFESKDSLTALATALALDESVARWQARVDGQPNKKSAHKNVIHSYLTPEIRDNPGTRCAFSGLVVDAGRAPDDSQVRENYAKALESLVGIVEGVQDCDGEERRGEALVQVSTLIGALLLSRATKGQPISNEILTKVRDRLAP